MASVALKQMQVQLCVVLLKPPPCQNISKNFSKHITNRSWPSQGLIISLLQLDSRFQRSSLAQLQTPLSFLCNKRDLKECFFRTLMIASVGFCLPFSLRSTTAVRRGLVQRTWRSKTLKYTKTTNHYGKQPLFNTIFSNSLKISGLKTD